jgi:predicted ATPase/class 3 adenylate cyclase
MCRDDGNIGLVSRSLPEGSVTFLFTDIEGSTRLLQRLGDRYPEVLAAHARLLREALARHGGREVATYGDAFFIAFADAGDAVAAAIDAQRSLLGEPWIHGSPVLVRMGLHTGTAAIVDDDYVGFDVHRAARIAAAAHGGQVVVSAETYEAIAGIVDGGMFLDLGEYVLKDLDEPEHIRQVVAEGLPVDFPPLASLEPMTNIPRRAGALVGRRREFAELRRLACDPTTRIVTVTGPGGVGKTRLTGAVALDALAEFSGGSLFVDLTALREADQVVNEVAGVFGTSAESGRPLLDVLAERIGRRRVLLVLDNFEQLMPAAAVVAQLVERCPRLTVMVTSRLALSLRDEITFPVPPLGLPSGTSRDEVEDSDACTLFVVRASAVRPGFQLSDADLAVVADVCELLDGLPLAIELAAARIKLFTPEQLRLRLRTRLRELAGGAADAPDRHRAMHATIDWSFQLLNPPEQVFFRDMAVFRGGATFDAIAQVVADDHDASEPLTALVNHNLVRRTEDERGEVRFDLLHVIRQYALDRFESSPDTETVRDRHSRYYVSLAEALGSRQDGDTTVASEYENLRSALDWLLDRSALRDEREASTLALRLANTLGRFWYRHGHLQEGVARLEHALAVATDADEMQRATALRHLGTLLETRRDVRAARACFEEALAICRRRSDRACEATCLNSLGIVARTAGDLAQAETNFLDSLALRRELDDVAGTATTLSNLALVVMDRDQVARALELLHEAHAIDRNAGNRWELACSSNNLGVAHLIDGHPEIGEPLIAEALRTFVELGDDDGVAESLEALAGVAASKDEAIRAIRLAGAANSLRQRAGIPPVEIDHQRLDRWVAQASAGLTEDDTARAHDEGRQMTSEQATRYALDETISALI